MKNQPTKKTQIGGGKWRRSYYRCTWYTYHIKDALDDHEQTGGGAGCERPRQRGTDASFTCASSVLWGRAASPAPAQPKNCRFFSTSSRWDHVKTNKSRISEIPRTGNFVLRSIQHQVKKQKNVIFGIRTSMPAEYWYVPRVSHVQKLHPTRSVLFILTWGGVWCRFLVLLLSTPA